MDHLPLTVFRRAALASGLLSVEQILEAEAALRAGSAGVTTWTDVGDEALAAKLVELGLLNHWQAEQLKLGRSKFNLGPYIVLDSIGQGGMGQVFKAEHRLMGRIVAVKVLPRHRSTPDAVATFTREIRAQAQFDHENLVRAYDAGYEGNVYFLVTEFVPGMDLRKLVRLRGKLSMQDAATIISQAARALVHAHARGLVHRDVKPGNLLVTPEGKTKLSDLGLASFLGVDDLEDPRAGRVVGTADYLSPEHITSPANMTPLADIYSLGCTLYYAVSGKVPFPGGNSREKARRHCEETPITPRRFNYELTDEFLDVISDLMAKNPRARIQSAEDVIRRLAPWASDTVAGTSDAGRPAFNAATARAAAARSDDKDTVQFDDLHGAAEDSPSQMSQRTDALAQGEYETLPDFEHSPNAAPGPAERASWLTLVLFVPLVLAAGLLIVSMVLKAVR